LITNEEKIAMKAACLQAAAPLIVAQGISKHGIDGDVLECGRVAGLLYTRVFGVD
jgi:hypothetical protein